MWRNKSKGFTLIEMLVVVSVTAVLAGLTLTGAGMVRKQARDTQRKSDLNQYRNALEAFASANNGKYPSYSVSVAQEELCSSLASFFGSGGCPSPPSTPPTGSFSYFYVSDGTGGGSADAIKYALYSRLEATSPNKFWAVCSNGLTHIALDPYGFSPDSLCDCAADPCLCQPC